MERTTATTTDGKGARKKRHNKTRNKVYRKRRQLEQNQVNGVAMVTEDNNSAADYNDDRHHISYQCPFPSLLMHNNNIKLTSSEPTKADEATITNNHSSNQEVVLSRWTNKPINSDTKYKKNEVIFWCGVCRCLLSYGVGTMLQHFQGKQHTSNWRKRSMPNESESLGPAAKKPNIAVSSDNKCENFGPAAMKGNIAVLPDNKCKNFGPAAKKGNIAVSSTNKCENFGPSGKKGNIAVSFANKRENFGPAGKKGNIAVSSANKCENFGPAGKKGNIAVSSANKCENFGPAAKKGNIAVSSVSVSKNENIGHAIRKGAASTVSKIANIAPSVVKVINHSPNVVNSLMDLDLTKKGFVNGCGRGKDGGRITGIQRGRGMYRSPHFGNSSSRNTGFNLQKEIKVNNRQFAIPCASQGEEGSKLRKSLIKALLEEEELWIESQSFKNNMTPPPPPPPPTPPPPPPLPPLPPALINSSAGGCVGENTYGYVHCKQYLSE